MAETGELDGMVHGCNCMHAMGSGIAGQLARRYPDVPAVDINETVCGDFSKLGTYTTAICDSVVDPSITFNVYNMYTQKTPAPVIGLDVFEYEAFEQGCKTLAALLSNAPGFRLGFPKIGAGLAGGDWNRIETIIYNAFLDVPITVNIVEWKN